MADAVKAISKKPQDTPEQSEIKRIRNGFHMVTANAGTGKTHTIAELVVMIYLDEERRLYPDLPPGQHIDGKQQAAMLRQIKAVTFTRDAAKELDDRIYGIFDELGIPTQLTKAGKRYRICRTIDSYVQLWMLRDQVIKQLLSVDPDMDGSLREKLGKMQQDTQDALKVCGEGNASIGLFRSWPWINSEDVDCLIFDAIHRGAEDAIAGVNPADWPTQFDKFLFTLTPPGVRAEQGERVQWGAGFWADKVEAWKSYQGEMHALNERFQRGELAGQPDYEQQRLRLDVWEGHVGARREFFAILELARSRGYHPVRSPEKLAALVVLQEIATADYWSDFATFHNFALQFYASKLRFGVMDYTDFLIACVDTFEQAPFLVERDKEYPRAGIRGKYVLYDEVQDNSVSNNRLFRVLCASKTVPYLAVAVGDAKQAIYGFRGACSYGFGQMIDVVRKRSPENIHHLTCSFRSLSKIVALGNECVMTLPSYKKTVQPSHTVYPEPGEIVLAPPLTDEQGEAHWVLQRVRDILDSTNESVMLLHRNNLREHPVVRPLEQLQKEYPDRIRLLTIHRSKGLQADNVFLMGMTATIMPDVRTNYTQMVNLLYVALTRPRKALFITAPYTLMRPNKEGVLECRTVGPSPFILRLPTLCALAERSGWPMFLLEKGESATKQAAMVLTAKVSGKESMLRRQWRALWPHIPIRDSDGDEYTEETGSAAPSAQIQLITRRSLYEGNELVLNAGPRLDEGIKERVRAKLRQAFLKNGQIPRLQKDEYMVALRCGWIETEEGGNKRGLSQSFQKEMAAA